MINTQATFKGKILFWLLFGLLALFNIADFLLTRKYLSIVGNYGEYNPVMRYIIVHWGFNSVAYVKSIPLIVMAACICLITPRSYRLLYAGLGALNAIALVVVSIGVYCLSQT